MRSNNYIKSVKTVFEGCVYSERSLLRMFDLANLSQAGDQRFVLPSFGLSWCHETLGEWRAAGRPAPQILVGTFRFTFQTQHRLNFLLGWRQMENYSAANIWTCVRVRVCACMRMCLPSCHVSTAGEQINSRDCRGIIWHARETRTCSARSPLGQRPDVRWLLCPSPGRN